jgi:hypothetical protein
MGLQNWNPKSQERHIPTVLNQHFLPPHILGVPGAIHLCAIFCDLAPDQSVGLPQHVRGTCAGEPVPVELPVEHGMWRAVAGNLTMVYGRYNYLVGGLEHEFDFPFHMGCDPSHWLSYFSRWLQHVTTTNQIVSGFLNQVNHEYLEMNHLSGTVLRVRLFYHRR